MTENSSKSANPNIKSTFFLGLVDNELSVIQKLVGKLHEKRAQAKLNRRLRLGNVKGAAAASVTPGVGAGIGAKKNKDKKDKKDKKEKKCKKELKRKNSSTSTGGAALIAEISSFVEVPSKE